MASNESRKDTPKNSFRDFVNRITNKSENIKNEDSENPPNLSESSPDETPEPVDAEVGIVGDGTFSVQSKMKERR